MKVISYYLPLPILARLRLINLHWTFWTDGIGLALPSLLGDSVTFVKLRNNHEVYRIKSTDFDIAYCHPYAIPNKRPARFVYTFLSDFRGHERELEKWIDTVRPNLLACLQDMPLELVEYCKSKGCTARLLPWFVIKTETYNAKDLIGMCTGCIASSIYPKRAEIYAYLAERRRSDVILSGSEKFGKYPLSNAEYRLLLRRARYYLSGGIYDLFIPPKYYEAANVGACIVSFPMPMMDLIGYVNGQTYISISSVRDIDAVLESDQYLQIGQNAQQMIRERHTVWRRAQQILEVFHELF